VLRLQASEEIKATADQSSPKSPPLVSKIGHSGSQCRDILSPVKIKQLTKTQLLSVSPAVLASERAAFYIQAVPGQHRIRKLALRPCARLACKCQDYRPAKKITELFVPSGQNPWFE
jgi:hypothetical protein